MVSPLGLLWRSALVGFGYALLATIAALVVGALGLPAPRLAAQAEPADALLANVLAGVLIGLMLGPLATRLEMPRAGRFWALYALVLVSTSLSSLVEAAFFTTLAGPELAFSLAHAMLANAGLSLLMAWLFAPFLVQQGLRETLGNTLSQRSWTGWVWRVGLAGLLYVPTYFVFGLLAYPFVSRYYEDPSLGLGLQVPDPLVILPLEIGRGLLFVLAVFPLVASVRETRWRLALWLGLTLTVLGAWVPMLQTTWFPPIMRLVHGLEITADALVHGAIIAWLVGLPAGSRQAVAGLSR